MRKAVALTVILTFTALQILPAGWAQPIFQENQVQKQIPEKTVSELPDEPVSQGEAKDSIAFLQDDHPLSRSSSDITAVGHEIPNANENEKVKAKKETAEQASQGYDYERYDFKDALDLLRSEHASAVILKNLTSQDLDALVHLSFETAIIVLHGEIVLFTSGSQDEIGVLPAAQELIQKASFISHTHPSIYSKEGPSGEDLNEAVYAPDEEYVVTHNGVYAYNNEGILNNGDPYSYDWYLDRLNQALQASKGDQDQVQARADLNQFIKDQDLYNQASPSEKETFRMGGTLTFTSGLTSANVTTVPGSPYPYFMTGSSSTTTLAVGTDGRFQLGYNVSTAGTYSGMTISFDNANTTAVETQNLSTFTNIVFGSQGPATALKLEFVDINGNKDSYTLTNVSSTTEQFWSIATSTIVSTVDKTKIRQINLFVDQSTTTSTTRTGTVYIRSYGLNTSAPAQGVVLFSDGFNRTSLGSDWSVIQGNYGMDTNSLFGFNSYPVADGGVVLNKVFGSNDYDIQVSTYYVNGGGVTPRGILARYQDLNNYYYVKVSRFGQATILKKQNGVTTTIATSTVSVNQNAWNVIRFIVQGNTLQLYFNGSLALQAQDTNNPLTTGRVGLYADLYGERFDDFSVTTTGLTPTVIPPVVNSVPMYTNVSTLLLSGTKPQNTSIWINGAQAVPNDSLTTWSYTVSLIEGLNSFQVTAKDSLGNQSTPTTISPTRDTVVPTGSINVNSGAAYTNSTAVTLNLSATDLSSGIDKMSFSTNNTNWSTPEVYAASKTYTLPSGDGTKTVYVKYYDKAGNVSTVYSKSIILDTVAPVIKTTSSYFQTGQGLTGYWNFESLSGTAAGDQSANGNTGTLVNGPLVSTDHPVTNFTNSGSLSFDGVNDFVSTATSFSNPTTFSLALWFKTTTTTGGKLIGFGSSQSGQSASFDRHVYMSNSGQIYFGVNPGSVQTINSTTSYNDGKWHHVVASLSGAGMQLYMDGILIASNSAVTAAQSYTGYWKIGYDNLSGWANVPSSYYFKGLIDEAQVYNRALSLSEVQALASGSLLGSVPVVTTNSVTVSYTSDGIVKSKTFNNLIQGLNDLVITEQDPAGNQTVLVGRVNYTPTATVNPPTVNAVSTYTNSTTLTLSGTKPTNTSVWINGSQAVPLDSLTTWSYPAALAEGLNSFSITTKDSTGTQSTAVNTSTTRDTILPTGSININSGATYTNATSVTLNLSAQDGTGSGISTMSFSIDSTTWSTPEAYATSKTYTLPTGDGTKIIYVKFFDQAGNQSTVYSKSITLDTVAPTGTIKINNDQPYTNSTSVTLTLTGTDTTSGLDQMRFSTDGGTTWTAWEVFATTKSLTLPTGDGTKTVQYQLKDKSGLTSTTLSDAIILDTAPPSGSIQVNGGAQYITQTSTTLNLSATDAGSGLSQMSFSTDNLTYSTPEVYNATKAWAFSSGDGNKTVYVKFSDQSGLWSSPISVTVLLDTILPTGSININSGAQYTSSTTVTLNLSSTDSGSGLNQMSFSNDNITYTTPEAYSTTKTYTLPTGDGTKTVYVKYYDKAGNVSTVYSKVITLDTVAPTGSVTINSGATYTNTATVTLTLTGTDITSGTDQMRFSTDGGTTWSAWEVFATTKTNYSLPSGDGTKTIQLQLKDKAGLTSSTLSGTIVLDTALPTGSININSGAPYATSTSVTLNLSASDGTGSGVSTMSFSTDNTTWTTPETYATSKTFTLPAGDGSKTIYVKYYDQTGNVSTIYSKSITLDTVVPTGTVTINNNAVYANSVSTTLTLTGSDATSGLNQMRFSTDGGTTWSAWEAFSTTKSLTLPTGDGTKTVQAQLQDKSGLISSTLSDTIILDTTIPTGSININSGATYTNASSVTLNLSASDGTGSGINQMSFSNDNTAWSTPEAYSTTKTYTLPTGDGTKTVYVKFFDQAGNQSAVSSKQITLDTILPVISNVISNNLTSTNATVTWTTNETSDTQVEYGLTTSYGFTTVLDSTLVTSHSQTMSNLQASTLYHYRVRSKDPAGNLQVSGDFTFTTQTSQATELGLNGYWNLDTVTNNTISDLSGTGNTGTLVNGVLSSTDHPAVNFTNSGSLSFDGVNDYVQVTNSASLNFGSGDFTISIWIKPNTITTTKQALVDKTDGTNGYRLMTSDTDGSRLKFIRGAYFADGIQSNAGALKAGVWQHVTVVISNNQVTFYVNGVNQGSGTLAAKSASTTTDLFIGQKGFSGSSVAFFGGNMDDLRVYNRALSSAEVQNLAQGNLHPTLPPTPPIINVIPQFINTPSITLTGSKPANTSVWINGGQAVLLDSLTTWSYTTPLVAGDGLYSFSVTTKDSQGNQSTSVTVMTTLDTAVPTGSVKINNDVTYTNSTNVTLNLVGNDTGSGLDQMRFSTNGGTTWTNWEIVVTTKSLTLPQGDGTKTVQCQLKDKAGNVATFSDTITLDTIAPVVNVLSSNATSTPDYTLLYQVDGVQKSRNETLVAGQNTLIISESDLAGNTTSLNYVVTYTPPQVDFPAITFLSPQVVSNPNYELTYLVNGVQKKITSTLNEGANLLTVTETGSVGQTTANYLVILNVLSSFQIPQSEINLNFNLSGTQATLVNPSFDSSGIIQGGWIKTASGSAYRLNNGALTEEFQPDGTRIFYDSSGRIHSKVAKDGSVTSFTYEINSSNQAVKMITQSGQNKAILDGTGLLLEFDKDDGTKYFFDAGRLIRIEKGGIVYTYSITNSANGSESQIVSPILTLDSPYPATIFYDSNHVITQLIRANGTTYNLDPTGLISRVTDTNGVTTAYVSDQDTAGLFDGLVVSRSGLTRNYGTNGSLAQLTDSDGSIFSIEGNQVVSIKKPDGTIYTDLSYDSTGVLQNAKILTTDGKTLLFQAQKLIQVTGVDGTILDLQNGKPTFSHTRDGRVYQYFESVDSAQNTIFTAKLIEFINQDGNRVILNNDRVDRIEQNQNGVLIVTTYSYDSMGRISEALVTRDGVNAGNFVYEYQGDGTQVKNQLGSIRYYDAQGNLTKLLTQKGEEYQFSSFTDPQGSSRILQQLTRVLNQLNGTTDYIDGKPTASVLPDGTQVKDIVLSPTGALDQATVLYPGGQIGLIQGGELKQITELDGTEKEYSGGLLAKVVTPSFAITNFSYGRDSSGNVSSIVVQDASGTRTYSVSGILKTATSPDGTFFTYDASGNLTQVKTPANEEFNYSNGILTSIKFSTGETLTGITLDGTGNLSSGTFNAQDGSRWIIGSGYLKQLTKTDGTAFYYDSAGRVTQIVKPNGDTITYNSSKQITQINRSNGAVATQITTDAQDNLVNAQINLNDGFQGFIYSNSSFNPLMGNHPLVNGTLKNPGSALTTLSMSPTTSYLGFIGDASTGKIVYRSGADYSNSIGKTRQQGVWLIGNYANAGYVKLTLRPPSYPDTFFPPSSVLFELTSGMNVDGTVKQVVYSINISMGDPVYVEIPQNLLGTFDRIRLSFWVSENNDTGLYVLNPTIVSRADYVPSDWVSMGNPYLNQKSPPSLPSMIGTALGKRQTVESTSQAFKIAQAYSLTSTSQEIFQISSIRNSVLSSALSSDAIVSATYDQSLNLLSAQHVDPSFNPNSNPNGDWKNAVSGWEDSGFAFAPKVTIPSNDVPIRMSSDLVSTNQAVTFQNGMQAIYLNDTVESVITPEGKVVHYQYSSDSAHPGLNQIIFDPDTADPSTTQVKYEFDRIREVRKNGVLTYLYSYEFDAAGQEITIITDVIENQIRKFANGKLLSVHSSDTGFTTTYKYDGSDRVIQAVTDRAGRIFGTFNYTYDGEDTIISEADTGISRRYGKDGVLKELVTAKGEVYQYSMLKDNQGEDLLLQELVRIVDSVRGTVDYIQGKPTRIVTPDGTTITDLLLNTFVDDNHITQTVIKQATVQFPQPDGRVALIENGKVIHITAPGGVVQIYSEGFLEKFVDQNGNVTTITYTKDASGAIQLITVEDKDGKRLYTKDSILTQSILPDTTQIDYELDGKIKRIQTPAGEIWDYQAGSLSSITFAGGGGKVEQIVLNSDGTLRSGVYTKDGVIYTIQNSAVNQKKELDGTFFFYQSSGKVNEIDQPVSGAMNRFLYDVNGKLNEVDRWDGRYAQNIITNLQDNLVNAQIYLQDGFSGQILVYNSTFSSNNAYPLVNGILKKPGTSLGSVSMSPTSGCTANNSTGYVSCSGGNWFDLRSITFSSSNFLNAGYLKLNFQQDLNQGLPQNFHVEFLNGSTVISTSSSFWFDQSYYVEMPQGVSFTNVRLTFGLAPNIQGLTGFYISDRTLYSRADYAPTDWIGVAQAFVNLKDRPPVPSIVLSSLSNKTFLEGKANSQFSLPAPAQLNQNDARTIYDTTLSLVQARLLQDDTVIAAAYRVSDSKLVMVARANNTIAHFVEDNLDYVTNLDGNMLIDYEYDAQGNLIHVDLVNAKKQLEAQTIKGEMEIARQTEQALMQLAIQRGNVISQIEAKLNDGLATINAERNRLIQESQQQVCRKVLFWKVCQTVQVDVSGQLAQLDSMEQDLRDEASKALADLDQAVAQEKTRLESDTKTAYVELEKQRNTTYREILKQELRPVIYNSYRKILGRDPSQDEVNAWLNQEIGDDQVTLLSFKGVSQFHGLTLTSAWASLNELKREVSASPTGVLAYLNDVGFVMVTGFANGQVTFVQRNIGNRTQDLVIQLVPWLDQNGNPIFDSSGHPILVQKYVFVQKDDGFGGDQVTVSESEFLSRWLKSSGATGAVFTQIPVSQDSVLMTNQEMSTLKGLDSWDILVEFFNRTFTTNLERINTDKLSAQLNGSSEYSNRLAQVNSIKQAVRDFLENQYLTANDATKATLLASLGLSPGEVISMTKPEMDRILDWLDSRDLHFGHSAFLAIQQLIAEGGIQASLFDIARQAILIDVLVGIIHPLTTGDLEISLFALNRVAQSRNISLTPAKVTFGELERELQTGKGILVHINGNHYVVVTKIDWVQKLDENGNVVLDATGNPVLVQMVHYLEKNVGPQGEEETLSREEFEKIWTVTKEGEGVVLTPVQVSPQAKVLTIQEAQKITGAFFGFIFGILSKIFSAIVSVVKAVFDVVKAVISVIASAIVEVVKFLADFVLELGKSLISLGKFFFDAVRFVIAMARGDKLSGFESLERALADYGHFLFFASTVAPFLVPSPLSPLEIIAAQIIALALSKGTGILLDKLGIKSPVIKDLATGFVRGGVLGFTGGLLGAGTTFLSSALTNLAMTGVSELALHIGLPPPIQTGLSSIAGILTGTILNPSTLPEAYKTLLPKLAQEIVFSGVMALGNAFGLDPRISSLIGLPLSIGASAITGRLAGSVVGYRDDGTLIYVTNPYDSGSILQSMIRGALTAGPTAIGFNFGGAATHPLFGSLASQDITSSIESALGRSGLFSSVFSLIDQALLSPFNLVNGILHTVLNGVTDFGSLIQSKGIAGAFDSLVTSIFSHNAIETIRNLGGITNVFNSVPKTLTTLITGGQAQELKINNSTSLFFDLAGNFIGKKDNSVTQIGTFGVDSTGKWALIAGKVIATIFGFSDLVFAGDVQNGQLMNGQLKDQSGNQIATINPEGGNGPIIIKGPEPDNPNSGDSGFWNALFNVLPYALKLFFDGGFLNKTEASIQPGSLSGGSTGRTSGLYVLANGIGNPETSSTIPPDYIQNLEADLKTQSQNQITDSDLLPIPLYQPTLPVIKATDNAFNKMIDSIKWVIESQNPLIHGILTGTVIGKLLSSGASISQRPIVAMGYSGGFIPLIEGLASGVYNIAGVVGLGAATVSLSRDLLSAVVGISDFILGKAVDGIETLLSKVGIIGVQIAQFINAAQTKVEDAVSMLRTAVARLDKFRPSLFSSLASSNAQLLVNLWGTQDILYQTGIAGYREELVGFTPQGQIDSNGQITKQLFNIEITGATHFDYMRRPDADQWNLTVSNFVTRLMISSKDALAFQVFLSDQIRNGVITLDPLRNVYVVNLPGHP